MSVLRQFYNLCYRGTRQFLEDSLAWRRAIGLKRTPDHNTICDAFGKILKDATVQKMLDHFVQCFSDAGMLKLNKKPLSVDASYYEHEVLDESKSS